MGFSFTGLGEVLSAITDMEARFSMETEAGVLETTTSCFGKMQDNCPVETGELRSTITMDVNGLEGSAGIPDGASSYAYYVEAGHHTRGGGRWVPGQFFLARAVLDTSAEFLASMEAVAEAL
jgi:hypothetical protein